MKTHANKTISMMRFLFLAILVLVALECDIKLQTQTTTIFDPSATMIAGDPWPKCDLGWSPDGTTLAFSREKRGTQFVLYSLTDPNDSLYGFLGTRFYIYQHTTISPDHARIAYVSVIGDLKITALDGSYETIVHRHFNGTEQEWSPDGNFIAYIENRAIWIVPVMGGTAIKVAEGSAGYSYSGLSWSPDSKQIASSVKQPALIDSTGTIITPSTWDIWIFPIEGGIPQTVTNDNWNNTVPAWSPDGYQIAYSSEHNDTLSLCITTITDGMKSTIINNVISISSISWSPDGSQIAFYGRIIVRDKGKFWIYSLATRELNFLPGPAGYVPFLSQNYSVLGLRTSGLSNICTVIPPDTQIIFLTPEFPEQYDRFPAWPDDDNIIFQRNNYHILVTPLTGGETTVILSDTKTKKYNLNMSPDGKKLVYDDGQDVYLKYLDQPGSINLTSNIKDDMTNPTWSPDGTQLACQSEGELKICRIAANQLQEETTIPGDFRNLSWSNVHPVFQSHIAADGRDAIYLISPEKHTSKPIIYSYRYPCWLKNGTQLAYVYDSGEYIFTKTIFYDLSEK